MSLEAKHPHQRDSNIKFFKSSHHYVVTRNGREEVVPVSVTSFCKHYFTQFNPRKVVDDKFEKWKSRPNSKYYAMIHASLQSGASKEATKQTIIDMWTGIGNKASDAGTDMHERAEHFYNGVEADENDYEMQLLKEWTKTFQPEMNWKPYRTEWILWWEEPRLDASILVAGTLDLLLKSETTGEFALVDFKRTNPNPKYNGGPLNLLGPCGNPRYHPGYASSPLLEVEDSKYGAYCMQLNILSKILRERYEIDVGSNMYLLQIHPDMQQAHCIRVPMHKQVTNSLFVIESERRLL